MSPFHAIPLLSFKYISWLTATTTLLRKYQTLPQSTPRVRTKNACDVIQSASGGSYTLRPSCSTLCRDPCAWDQGRSAFLGNNTKNVATARTRFFMPIMFALEYCLDKFLRFLGNMMRILLPEATEAHPGKRRVLFRTWRYGDGHQAVASIRQAVNVVSRAEIPTNERTNDESKRHDPRADREG